MSTLQILCPNGRRQNVKITPNTKLLQVLEEVCQKQKFLPVEEYKLMHGRTTIDLTLSVRFANLANNAKLELMKCERVREEKEVLIALQLETGERLQHTFHPGVSLWDILVHWENIQDSPHKDKLTCVDSSQSAPTHPVCIYMREEMKGELQLRNTQLRTLGLTGGKAALRLFHRPLDDKTLADIANNIEKERQRKEKLEKSMKPITATTSSVSVQTPPTDSTNSLSSTQTATVGSDNATISLNINVNIQNRTDNQPIRTEGEEPATKVGRIEKSSDYSEPMEIEQSDSSEAIMETEENVKEESTVSNTSNQGPGTLSQQQRDRREATQRLIQIPGVQVFTPDDFSDLTAQEQEIARRLAERYLPSLGVQPGNMAQPGGAHQGARAKKQTNTQPKFADFKFPEATKGQQLYKNEIGDINKGDFKPCDRETCIYNIEENIRTDSTDIDSDLPEDFFELTEKDMRTLLNAQKKAMGEFDNQPLMTSSMRKAKLDSTYGGYEKVVIRVQFHDKLVLQGLFRPRETVFAIQKFVKDHLEDKNIPFYLYTTPPKSILKDRSDTLIEAKLVPATVVYFGCEEHRDHYLSDACLSEICPRIKAEEIVANCLNLSLPTRISDEPTAGSSSDKGKQPVRPKPVSSSTQAPSPSSSSSATSQGASTPVPKWFKVGKK